MARSGSWTNLKISWRNLGRNPKRTALAWLGIAVAQLTLVWISSFINGYEALIFQKLTGPMLGHLQIHAPKYRDDNAIERTIPRAASVIQQVRQHAHVGQVSARVYAPVLATAQELGHVALVTGMDIPEELGPAGLLEGLPVGQLPGAQEVLVGKGLADEMSLHPGDTLALMGQAVDGSIASGLYRIKGVVRSSVEQIDRAGIVMPLKTSQELLAMDDQVHELAVHVDDPAKIPEVTGGLKKDAALASFDIKDWQELVPQLAALLQVANSSNLIILVLVFLTSVAGIANTMLMATFERSHEFGMLLALGCRPMRLIRILLLESMVLGFSGVAIGSIAGVLLVLPEIRYGIDLAGLGGMGRDMTFSMEGINLGLVIFPVLKLSDVTRGVVAVIVTSAVATLWPARRISRLEPVEAMRS